VPPNAEADAPKRKSWRRRLRWPVSLLAMLVVLEVLAGQFVARPNRILRPSRDPELIYESTPGTWLGHAKADVWRAPLYVVLDLIHLGDPTRPVASPPPPGYTLYRIDQAGCRAPSTRPIPETSEVVVLGSSQGFGMLVPAEDTVSAMLQTQLRARGFAGVSVGNCGVIGQHIVQTFRTAELVRPVKQPRLMVMLVRPWHLTEQFDYTRVLVPRSRVWKWLIDRSNLARLMFYVHNRERGASPPVPRAQLTAKIDQYLRNMQASNVRSLFFLLDDATPGCEAFPDLMAQLRERGVPVERIWTPRGPNSYFVDRDRHWSRRGAELTTSEMIDAVQRELTVARAAQR